LVKGRSSEINWWIWSYVVSLG